MSIIRLEDRILFEAGAAAEAAAAEQTLQDIQDAQAEQSAADAADEAAAADLAAAADAADAADAGDTGDAAAAETLSVQADAADAADAGDAGNEAALPLDAGADSSASGISADDDTAGDNAVAAASGDDDSASDADSGINASADENASGDADDDTDLSGDGADEDGQNNPDDDQDEQDDLSSAVSADDGSADTDDVQNTPEAAASGDDGSDGDGSTDLDFASSELAADLTAASSGDVESASSMTPASRQLVVWSGAIQDFNKIKGAIGTGNTDYLEISLEDGDPLGSLLSFLNGKGSAYYDAIHFVSQGNVDTTTTQTGTIYDGYFLLGSTRVDASYIAGNATDFGTIGASLKADGDIFLYSYHAGNDTGFLQELHDATGCDVRASKSDNALRSLTAFTTSGVTIGTGTINYDPIYYVNASSTVSYTVRTSVDSATATGSLRYILASDALEEGSVVYLGSHQIRLSGMIELNAGLNITILGSIGRENVDPNTGTTGSPNGHRYDWYSNNGTEYAYQYTATTQTSGSQTTYETLMTTTAGATIYSFADGDLFYLYAKSGSTTALRFQNVNLQTFISVDGQGNESANVQHNGHLMEIVGSEKNSRITIQISNAHLKASTSDYMNNTTEPAGYEGGAFILNNVRLFQLDHVVLDNAKTTYSWSGNKQTNWSISAHNIYGDGGLINFSGNGNLVLNDTVLQHAMTTAVQPIPYERTITGGRGGAIYFAGNNLIMTGDVTFLNTTVSQGTLKATALIDETTTQQYTLGGGAIFYVGNYTQTRDAVFQEGVTYYYRAGLGTSDNPYVYAVAEVTPGDPLIGTYYRSGQLTVEGGAYVTRDTVFEYGRTYYTRTGTGTDLDPYVYNVYDASGRIGDVITGTYYNFNTVNFHSVNSGSGVFGGVILIQGGEVDWGGAVTVRSLNSTGQYGAFMAVVEAGNVNFHPDVQLTFDRNAYTRTNGDFANDSLFYVKKTPQVNFENIEITDVWIGGGYGPFHFIADYHYSYENPDGNGTYITVYKTDATMKNILINANYYGWSNKNVSAGGVYFEQKADPNLFLYEGEEALVQDKSTLTIEGSSFVRTGLTYWNSNNYNDSRVSIPTGGAIYFKGGTLTVTGEYEGTYHYNADSMATRFSAASAITYGTYSTAEDYAFATFEGTRATNGGAIYVFTGDLILNSVSFGAANWKVDPYNGTVYTAANNTNMAQRWDYAETCGGAIYFIGGGDITFNGTTVIQNTGTVGNGGIIYTNRISVTTQNVTYVYDGANNITANGDFLIDNAYAWGNWDWQGGIFYLHVTGDVTFNGRFVANNINSYARLAPLFYFYGYDDSQSIGGNLTFSHGMSVENFNCSITENGAAVRRENATNGAGGTGGLVYFKGGNLTIAGELSVNHLALSSNWTGGVGLFWFWGNDLTIDGDIRVNDVASYQRPNNANAVNWASWSLIYFIGHDLTIINRDETASALNPTFTNLTGNGAIYFYGYNLTVENVWFDQARYSGVASTGTYQEGVAYVTATGAANVYAKAWDYEVGDDIAANTYYTCDNGVYTPASGKFLADTIYYKLKTSTVYREMVAGVDYTVGGTIQGRTFYTYNSTTETYTELTSGTFAAGTKYYAAVETSAQYRTLVEGVDYQVGDAVAANVFKVNPRANGGYLFMIEQGGQYNEIGGAVATFKNFGVANYTHSVESMIYANAAVVTIENAAFTNITASGTPGYNTRRTAIMNAFNGSQVTISNSTFNNIRVTGINEQGASYQGGLFSFNASHLTLTDVAFSNLSVKANSETTTNDASRARGGIATIYQGSLTINGTATESGSGSTFSDIYTNSYFGGLFYAYAADVTINGTDYIAPDGTITRGVSFSDITYGGTAKTTSIWGGFYMDTNGVFTAKGVYMGNTQAGPVTGTSTPASSMAHFVYGAYVVSVSDSTFENNAAGGAGAVIRSGGGDVIIDNSIFVNNSATWGGVFYSGSLNTLYVTNSQFIRNSANAAASGHGGVFAFYNPWQNAGPATVRNITIADSVFDENSANGDQGMGGVLFYLSANNDGQGLYSMQVTGSTFRNNHANYAGGAFLVVSGATTNKYYYGKLTFEDNTFEDNYVKTIDSKYLNDTDGQGRLKYISNSNGSVFTWVYGGVGGALYIQTPDTYVTGSTFTNNSADRWGGAIWLMPFGTWSNGNNLSTPTRNFFVTDSVFSGNYAAKRGGAIYYNATDTNNESQIDIEGSLFNGNVAGQYLTYAYTRDSDGNIISVNVTPNGMVGDAAQGGALYIGLNVQVTVDNTTFYGNRAGAGSVAYIAETANTRSVATFLSVTAVNNSITSANSGTIDFQQTHYGYVISSVFMDNTIGNNSYEIYFSAKTSDHKIQQYMNNGSGTNWWGWFNMSASARAIYNSVFSVAQSKVYNGDQNSNMYNNANIRIYMDMVKNNVYSATDANVFGGTPVLADNGGSVKTIAIGSAFTTAYAAVLAEQAKFRFSIGRSTPSWGGYLYFQALVDSGKKDAAENPIYEWTEWQRFMSTRMASQFFRAEDGQMIFWNGIDWNNGYHTFDITTNVMRENIPPQVVNTYTKQTAGKGYVIGDVIGDGFYVKQDGVYVTATGTFQNGVEYFKITSTQYWTLSNE